MENPVVSCSALRRRARSKRNTEVSVFDESYISDDIIIEILSRLSTKIVLRCRFVCRRWRNLTSTRDFAQLHIRRSCFPMILKNDIGQNLLISFWESTRARLKLHRVYEPYHEGLVLSHNGLIVSRRDSGYRDFIIYNPIYSNVVNISLGGNGGTVLGVFFHHVLKEYCILWQVIASLKRSDSAREVQYKILNLECNPIWRDIKNPYTQHVRNHNRVPELIGQYIYWMVVPYQHEWHHDAFNSDIMQYDTRNEEFKIIPCPLSIVNERNVNMMDIDGVLSLVHVVTSKKLTIWTLKDEGDRFWKRSNYNFNFDDVYRVFGVGDAVVFWNGELVLESYGRLYACNLRSGTCRKFWPKYAQYVGFWPHKTSLVSLRNCKSEICMVEEDENSQ